MRLYIVTNPGWASPTKMKLAGLVAALLIAAVESRGQNARSKTPANPQQKSGPEAAVERRVVVSVPDHKLEVIEDSKVVKTYRVAVGARVSPSPTGEFKIINRISKPTYYAPGVVIPAGEDNPLGPRWIGLSLSHFGIHGTNQPRSIGHNSSHGCIRMRNADVEELFERVRVGDTVVLVGGHTEEIARIFGGAPAVVLTAAEHAEPLKQVTAEAAEDGGQEQKAVISGQQE